MSSLSSPVRVPKILGADVELGNFISGVRLPSGSGDLAARLLLNQIEGIPARRTASSYGSSLQDWGRRFLPGNGGCAYIDLDHLELAVPETATAFDFVAQWRAMLAVARDAQARATAALPPGHQVRVYANCSDSDGHSYGAHMNVLLTRTAYNNIVRLNRPHYLAFLAAFQASSIVFTGAGKVGAENGRSWVPFQLSQRADFVEMLLAEQTTYRRPFVNSRDEPLCGQPGPGERQDPELARLHVIFFDATWCQVATLLRAGTLQIITSMLEAEVVDARLALDDPLDALERWSRDPSLTARARLVDGTETTALDLQQHFLERARLFGESHGFAVSVPRADEILAIWGDTLTALHAGDTATTARRLDWVLKQQLLERAVATRTGLAWSSPELVHLDQTYAALDPTEGLFLACEQAGLVDMVVSHGEVEHARSNPPADTRAWTRAHLLRQAGRERVDEVDWDAVCVRVETGRRRSVRPERKRVRLSCPYAGTHRTHAGVFAGSPTLEEVVERLQPDDAEDAPAPLPVKYTVS